MLTLHDFRVRQRDFLLEISRAITAQLDLGEVLRLVLNASVVMLASEVGLIALREMSGRYRVRATLGIDNEHIGRLNLLLEDFVSDVPDSITAERINDKLREIATSLHPSLKQSIALPLTTAGEPSGLLIVFRAYRGSATPDDLQVLQSFADQAAIAVHNAQLYAGIDQERRRLAAILQHSADGVMILDADLNIVSFNTALERITAWDAAAAFGLHVANVIRWDNDNINDVTQFVAQGWPYNPVQGATTITTESTEADDEPQTLYVEGDIVRRDGVTLAVGITYAPLLARTGHLTNVIANVRDITNFRKAQEMQNMFVSTVSHELRTPITLIKGYAETLSRSDVTWNKDVVRDGLAVISEESDRLNGLVDNLITASKIQARQSIEINLDATHLDQVAARAVERFQTRTTRHTLQLNFMAGFPTIEADEVRLRQVIDNLLSNALKYSPDGGIIEVSGAYNDDSVTIYVRDQGIGMTQSEQEHLFERFYRVDNFLSRKTEGTGLGLYLSQAIVNAHGGTIAVDSQPGQGSTFYFSLAR
jgi:signal transduction histidine kinase